MKKHAIAVFVGFITFFLGSAVVVDRTIRCKVGKNVDPIVAVTQPSAECRRPASFPGRAQPLKELTKFKKGYFPVKAFDDGWHDADAGMNEWYGKFLRAMQEPSLFDIASENDETYRFLWLRTFDHPVSIRVQRSENHIELKAVEFDGAGGYEPGKKYRTDNYRLSVEQWCEFIGLLDASEYWKLETVDRTTRGLDGSQWILEGVKNGRYHVVDRWTPREGNYREACLYLLELSGRNTKTPGNDLY